MTSSRREASRWAHTRPAASAHVSAAGQGAGGEAGFTLVEILISVVILGLAFTAVLGGMATSIQTSDQHRQQAQVQAVLASAVELVKSPETPRLPCGENNDATIVASYQTAARSVAPAADAVGIDPQRPAWPGSTINVVSVTYSDGNGGFGTTCYDDATHAVPVVGGTANETRRLLTLQQVTIRVTHPGGRASQSLTFLKGVG